MNTEPSYHPEACGLAINVKDRTRYDHDRRGDDAQRTFAYQQAQRGWWRDAKELAIRHGFDDIGCCGRSGGWAFPIPVIDPGDERTDPDGYAEQVKRAEALAGDIADMMMPIALAERFTAELDIVLAEDAELDRRLQLHQRNAERYDRGVAMLAQLARDVIACDTTSEFIAQHAMEALALLEPEA